MKIIILPQPVSLLKLMMNYFAQVVFKGESFVDVIL